MEVLSLNLLGTELIVLSACDTSIGKVVSGEGVYSLRRAFQEAGTKAILSSLWPASDEGTLQLMKKFYHHYLNNISPQSALCNAQIECINEREYSHPYYWANFVMVGIDRHFPNYSPKEASKRKPTSVSLLLILGIALFVGFVGIVVFLIWKK